MGPGDLSRALCGLDIPKDPNLIVGIERIDDAGVYRISDELALIQTVDFFTPIVDDPYFFGQIAAANALSDVYAMGGKPLTAMNIVCFPSNEMEMSVLHEILRGGLEKLNEAGCMLVGGHSVEDRELKYGLAVTGVIHPDSVVKNQGAKEGDRLILTKPLGTGIIATAIKASLAEDKVTSEAIEVMTTLNKNACEAMMEIGISAATDITGFGFLGHAAEMIDGTDVGIVFYASKIPYISQAEEFAQYGLIPAGTYRNKDFRAHMVEISQDVPSYIADILFDPQTSGGLLIAVSPERAERLLYHLREKGVRWASLVGEVTAELPGKIKVIL